MPLSTTMIGALLGLGTQMYSNALRKLPYMRRMLLLSLSLSLPIRKTLIPQFRFPFVSRENISPFSYSDSNLFPLSTADPWEHVLGMGIGAVFVNQLVKWDAQLQEDLDKMLEKAKAANERRYFGKYLAFPRRSLFEIGVVDWVYVLTSAGFGIHRG